MSVDPEPESSTEPQDALEPQTDESGPEDELGDAGTSKGNSFINPISTL
jgi:hypothetical protein